MLLWVGPKGRAWELFTALCRGGGHEITHCADGHAAAGYLRAMAGGIDGIILAGTETVHLEGGAGLLQAVRAMGEDLPVINWQPLNLTQETIVVEARQRGSVRHHAGDSCRRRRNKPWVVLEYHAPIPQGKSVVQP